MFAYTRYFNDLEQKVGVDGRDRSLPGLATVMLRTEPPQNQRQGLPPGDRLKHDILACAKARGTFKSSTLREEFRHRANLATHYVSLVLLPLDSRAEH